LALIAVFGAALLAIIMLLLIIRQLRVDQNALRDQLVYGEQQLAESQQQQMMLHEEVARVKQEMEDMMVTSPVEWNTCLSCRTPPQVVLCPHCNAPYHKVWVSPRGKTLNCWDAVLASGRCWNCRKDLTPFQKAPVPMAAAAVSAPVVARGAM